MTDAQWMALALEQARLAELAGEVPIGAVLVRDGQMLAAAGNQTICAHDPCGHAEIGVLRAGGQVLGNHRLNGCALYVTLEPCVMCAGVILQARLGRVVFGARDPKAGAVATLYQILNDSRLNHQVEVTEGALKEECAKILSRFFKEKRVGTHLVNR